MAERNASGGYIAIGKETVKGTPVTPAAYVPYYKQSLVTDIGLISDEPVFGNKFVRFQALQGMRSHGGSLSVMAEPNTAAYFHDMLSTKTSTTGANPYTHLFQASNTTDPNSYTLDISLVSQVVRFMGVEANKLAYAWNNDRMTLDLDVAALKSFYGREIATAVTTTVTLKTDYDPRPTDGLVNGDLIKLTTVDGVTVLNTTISSVNADGITLTLGASAAAFTAGDMLVLRPATPSFTLLTPFLWGKTQFCFGATAAAALSATQTRLEQGSAITLMHDFDNKQGSQRSGQFDPASLPRSTYDLTVKLKKYFDLPDDIKNWNALVKRALVMRAYAGATNQYELRVTLNNMKIANDNLPTDSGNVIFQEFDFMPTYDTSDGQAFDVKVINALATI
jgi:hypothetical protein